VVGATGATGKHVVQFLLDQGQTVKVVARSKERMISLLSNDETYYGTGLQITEASILELSDQELQELVEDCDAVVSCLGHNLTISGIWGKNTRRLVTDSVRRLTEAMPKDSSKKFVLMGSDGVAAPNDNRRGWLERSVLWLLRYLVPPHADNEQAAAYLAENHKTSTTIEWVVVRPTDLKEAEVSKFQLYDKPPGSLFGSGIATKANVAQFMVELVLNKDNQWEQYKYQMPVLHDVPVETKKGK
jgi:nucleoside-diphosphate-sugar epimerase